MNCQELALLCHHYEAYFLLWFYKLQSVHFQLCTVVQCPTDRPGVPLYTFPATVTLVMGWLVADFLGVFLKGVLT